MNKNNKFKPNFNKIEPVVENKIEKKFGMVNVPNNSKLNIRKEANSTADIIGTLHNNVKIELVEETEEYYKTTYNNITGYVAREYVKIDKE